MQSYDTGVTLRQLFYRLVSERLIPNTEKAYQSLSDRTSKARRQGWFPPLVDRTRRIDRAVSFASPEEALEAIRRAYRRDRTGGQDVSLYLGVEKDAIAAQLTDWFGDLGVPVVALRGYSSVSLEAEVVEDVARQGRRAVLLYAGDFDATGEDIGRNFVTQTKCFAEVVRVALTAEQVEEYELPPQPGKEGDSRARSFVERHGRLVQVEMDALPPDVLRGLYQAAIDRFWDSRAYDAVMWREEQERQQLPG